MWILFQDRHFTIRLVPGGVTPILQEATPGIHRSTILQVPWYWPGEAMAFRTISKMVQSEVRPRQAQVQHVIVVAVGEMENINHPAHKPTGAEEAVVHLPEQQAMAIQVLIFMVVSLPLAEVTVVRGG